MRRRLLRWLGGAVALLFGCAILAGSATAQTGTISGRITEQATSAPLSGARVFLGGTNRSVVANADGRFTLPNVPVGTHEVRASQIGFAAASQSVTVTAGETAEANFQMKQTAVTLDAYIVTASGAQQAARENPASVTTVNLGDQVPTAPVTSMADALNARGGGVNVMPSSGTTGAGARVRIRGSNSVSLSNEPVIVVDGIRVESGANSNSVGVGGQVPSRINDINPDDIESYQVIKGPASSALYGTAAANGIIELRTKRGRPGPARWNTWAEHGAFPHFDAWPNNVFGFDPTKAVGSALRYGCTLNRVALAQCTQGGGLFILNPLTNDSPFRNGSRAQYGLNVSGGNEQTTYYLSGEATSEDGVYKISDLTGYSVRANITNRPSEKLDLAASTGYVSSTLRLPDNDNNALGFLGSGLLGGSDTLRRGWGFLLPEESYQIITLQGVERFTGSMTADARPFTFLTARAVVGLDVTHRIDSRTFPPNRVPFNSTTVQGSRAANPVEQRSYTANFSATARFDLNPNMTSSTTAGSQFFREKAQTITASGQKLAGGTSSLNGIGIPTVGEAVAEARTFGLFIEEQLGIKNRLFLTAALRGDDNSAFGKDFDFIKYPKVGASWVISEEPFFPSTGGVVSSLRVRSAWGQSGLQPGVTDALLYFDPVPVTADNTDQIAFTVGNLGNSGLKPERSREFEGGFDAGLFNDKLRLEFTYYDKLSKDALVSRPLAPSLGVSAAQFYNLGSVSNKGVEISLSGRALDRPNFAVDFALTLWGNKNRLVDLGKDFLGNDIPSIVFGTQRHVEGYPLGGYWVRPYTFADANNDGIISQTEVTLGPSFQYVGTPYPTQGATFSTGLTMARRVRVNALLDYRSGHKLYNLTGDFRCRQNVCPEVTDPSTPLAEQAGAIAAVFYGQPGAYVEDASFLKVREISLTFYAPAAWARQFGGSEMSISVSGRNLFTSTNYSGFDPEVNQNAQANFTTTDFLTQPPVRFFSARINVTF